MNLSGMKFLDRYAGSLLCGLLRLTLLGRSTSPPADQIRRLLVIKFWGMGGLILTAPLFAALRAEFPRAEIHLATLAGNRELAEWLKLADQVHLLDLSGSWLRIAANILRFLRQVRRLQADAALDLEYLTRFSALVAGVSRAPWRIGFAGPVFRGRLHNRLVHFRSEQHVSRNFLDFAAALKETPRLPQTGVSRPRAAERKPIEEFLSAQGIGPEDLLIVVNPNAGALALERRWPAQYFVTLLDRITRAELARLALIGAPEEAVFVADLRRSLKRPEAVLDLAGRLNFVQLKSLLARADLLITNDSGPLHLAALMGTPTLSFFGPETPRLYAPVGHQHIALYASLPCSPCIRIETAKTVHCIYSRPECLFRISPEQAWAGILKLLPVSPRR